MKLLLPCMQCFQELGYPRNEFSFFEFRDDGRHEVCCTRGHKSITVLQQQKFEILFDIGAHAIIDGYYRESISSFTSSLERFYEFCIKVICERRKVNEHLFAKSWKTVVSQSERQFGAFLFLWVNEFGELPIVLSNKEVEFRNKVIHQGKIPNKDDALKYGTAVLNIVRPLLQSLYKLCPDEISTIIFRHIRDCSIPSDTSISSGTSLMSISTIMSLTGDQKHNNRTLDDAIAELYKWRERILYTEKMQNSQAYSEAI